MPELRGRRQRLHVRGGTLQQHASRGRYVIQLLLLHVPRFRCPDFPQVRGGRAESGSGTALRSSENQIRQT